MRFALRSIVLGVLLLLPGTQASGQERSTSVLVGYGGIDYEGRLTPAYHVNVRRELVGRDSLVLAPRRGRRRVLPKMQVQGEFFGQRGGGGTGVVNCREDPGSFCVQSADPLFAVGAGLVGRFDLTRVQRWGVVYFLPLTAGAYLRGFDVQESPLGSSVPVSDLGVRLSGGVGNGAGVELRIGQVRAVMEVRAIITRDLQGGRGGSLPVSVGVSW